MKEISTSKKWIISLKISLLMGAIFFLIVLPLIFVNRQLFIALGLVPLLLIILSSFFGARIVFTKGNKDKLIFLIVPISLMIPATLSFITYLKTYDEYGINLLFTYFFIFLAIIVGLTISTIIYFYIKNFMKND